jgi:hypothetical protein
MKAVQTSFRFPVHNLEAHLKMQYQIPKRIIQTGKHIELPLRSRAMVSNLRLLNPEFEYMFFDNEGVQSFIDQEFPQYRTVFDAFPFPIQRYDFFRYLAVYRHGGFYFDLDVMLASDLSSLLNTGCVFPFEGLTLSRYLRKQHKLDWEIGNFAFGAAPGHPFLEAVIENCVRAQKDPDWIKPMMAGFPPFLRSEYLVLNTTGPGLITRTLAENTELAKEVQVLFPKDLSDMSTWNRFGDLGIHMMEGSWRTRGAFLRRRMANYWEYWQLKKLAKRHADLRKTEYAAHIGNAP